MAETGLVSMRRYVLVRAAWQLALLFVFVSLAYVAAWVLPKETLGHNPGYGGFLTDLVHGSLGTFDDGSGARSSVRSFIWDATRGTLSLLLVTGIFAVALGGLLAVVAVRGGRWAVQTVSAVLVSLLPIWVGLYLAIYVGAKWEIVRPAGYCSLGAGPAGECHGFWPWLSSLLLPALSLSLYFAAIYARWLATAFRRYRAELQHDPDARPELRRRHGLAFAKLLARDFGFAIGFATFVEVTFGLPGLGRAVAVAAFGPNSALLAGALVAASVLAAAVSFVVDVACAAVDPRFRAFARR
jgi:peptide/nickel transport system permease protein